MPVDSWPLAPTVRTESIVFCQLSSHLSGRRGSNPRPTAWKAVALPTELLPLMHFEILKLGNFEIDAQTQFPNWAFHPDSNRDQNQRAWAEVDSNHRSRKTADLQSAPFGRSGTRPTMVFPPLFASIEPLVGIEPTTY